MSVDACNSLFLEPYGGLGNFKKCAQVVQVLKTTKHAEWWRASTETPGQTVVVKVFLNPQSVQLNSLQATIASFLPDTVQASPLTNQLPATVVNKLYQYYNEQRLYANVLQPLLLYEASPHFYFSRGEQNISLDNLVQMYGGTVVPRERFAQVIAQMVNPDPNRSKNNSLIPSDSDVVPTPDVQAANPENYFFNALLLSVPAQAQKLTALPTSNSVQWEVLFQVAVACYALQLSCLTHNDLKPRCIEVVKGAHVQYLLVNKLCYALHTQEHVYVTKFQKATQGQDQFQPLKDFLTFCVHYANGRTRVIDELLPIFVNTDATPTLSTSQLFSALEETPSVPRTAAAAPAFSKIGLVQGDLRGKLRGRSQPLPARPMLTGGAKAQLNKYNEVRQQFTLGLSIADGTWKLLQQYAVLNSLEDIIFLLSQRCKNCQIMSQLPPNKVVYTLHPDMFSAKGRLNTVLNHSYALHKYEYYISTPDELDNQIQFTNQQIAELEAGLPK
jgi:hypothetical protein